MSGRVAVGIDLQFQNSRPAHLDCEHESRVYGAILADLPPMAPTLTLPFPGRHTFWLQFWLHHGTSTVAKKVLLGNMARLIKLWVIEGVMLYLVKSLGGKRRGCDQHEVLVHLPVQRSNSVVHGPRTTVHIRVTHSSGLVRHTPNLEL